MKKQAWLALLMIGGCATETDFRTNEVASHMGVDYSWDRPSPQGLVAAGYTFAVRYASFVRLSSGATKVACGEAGRRTEHGVAAPIVVRRLSLSRVRGRRVPVPAED
jgi:hypothetical protein